MFLFTQLCTYNITYNNQNENYSLIKYYLFHNRHNVESIMETYHNQNENNSLIKLMYINHSSYQNEIQKHFYFNKV